MNLDMAFLEKIYDAASPILPGLVVAVVFILLGVVLQLRFRGQSIVQRIRRPVALFYVYIVLFSIVVVSKVYWVTMFRFSYLVSLLILSLAVILALSVGLFDLFLTKYRKISLPTILRDLTVLVVYATIVVLVLSQEGVEVTSLVTTSAVFTAIIGFALQDLLSNVISGVAIQIETPFAVGDWVKFDNFEGKVEEINWRATKIKTLSEAIVVIPNNVATRSPIVNFSEPSTIQRREIVIGLRYEAQPNKVHRSLLKAVNSVDGVLAEPPARILTSKYGDFAIEYRILFFINNLHQRERIEGDVNTRIWYQLKRDKFSIPFPIRDINVRTISDEDEKSARTHHVNSVVSMLLQVPTFAPLSQKERTQLATKSQTMYFAANEEILSQGQTGSSFYIIEEGEVEVYGIDEDTKEKYELSILGRNDFFGERSLMTGDPVSATAVAQTDCMLQVFDKDAFSEILVGNKELVTIIGAQLAKRKSNADTARKKATNDIPKIVDKNDQASLVKKIKNFFQIKE